MTKECKYKITELFDTSSQCHITEKKTTSTIIYIVWLILILLNKKIGEIKVNDPNKIAQKAGNFLRGLIVL